MHFKNPENIFYNSIYNFDNISFNIFKNYMIYVVVTQNLFDCTKSKQTNGDVRNYLIAVG